MKKILRLYHEMESLDQCIFRILKIRSEFENTKSAFGLANIVLEISLFVGSQFCEFNFSFLNLLNVKI